MTFAKNRDGTPEIWGTITRPTKFESLKKYPVIENIYSGPRGSVVPKTFSAVGPDQSLAELRFIVIDIDGIGTGNRSKAFRDVALKNFGNAGLPDRILWHKTASAMYPNYDISRVGIFGISPHDQKSSTICLVSPTDWNNVPSGERSS
jgi:dipeptidyl aminopeptidase/acylaminoacyl peptidase